MSLESYTGKIADLVVTNPQPTDPKSQGDDHLRGIKYTMVQDAVRVSGSPLQQMGVSATLSENHYWDSSVPNQLTLKRGVPDAPGATVMQVEDGTPSVTTLQLGRNADQSKNFKITVPTPEDGTLTIERANGTDVMKFLANGGVDMPSLPFSKAANGYMTLPNGLILQWGTGTITTSAANTPAAGAGAFSIPFPTALLHLSGSCNMVSPTNQTLVLHVGAPDSANWSFRIVSTVTGLPVSFQWIAIGY